MDNHTAMSLMTGMLRPSGGAWKYAANWVNWKAETIGAEVAVHCRCSNKKKFQRSIQKINWKSFATEIN